MKQNSTLDAIDRKIVLALQVDATISNAALAEHVGSSMASCWRRVKALETSGVLTDTVRLVNPVVVGRSVNVFCNIRLKNHNGQALDEFEESVKSRPEIVECFLMSGDWDYLLRILVSDVDDFNIFHRDFLLGHPWVAGTSSHFALSTAKYTTALPI